MPHFLILKLVGPMQAWGGHTYEDFRPSHLFPTRSGLLGLLGACLGIDRYDREGLQLLASSIEFTVRADWFEKKRILKLPDFHTVLEARKVDGSPNKNPVLSRREYLFDASFTVAIGETEGSKFHLDMIAEFLRKPCYTPSLGRRSCPLTRPLFDCWREAANGIEAVKQVPPNAGVIYGEGIAAANARPMPIRDVPQHGRHRKFGTRWVYVHADKGGE